ncbi:carboxymuconolactone decarboxylase family protein [Chloroflexota bacterium]
MTEKKGSEEEELEGLEQSIQLFGEEHVRMRMRMFDRYGPEVGEIFRNLSYRGLYARKVLDLRTRQLCTVSALTVLNALPQLKTHVKAALRVGATQDEVKEAIIQMVTYCGSYKVAEAFKVYEGIIAELK